MLGRPTATAERADSIGDAATPGRTLASSIVTRVMPASFEVIAVPIPDTFAGASPVAFEILDLGIGRIVGRRAGVVDGRSLLVTIGVPRDALAGRRTFAHVRLATRGRPDEEIPLELEVGVVRRIVLSPARAEQGAAAGIRLQLTYRVTNEGNAFDSVLVHGDLPAGWRRLDKPRRISIAPGATIERTMRIALPSSAGPGAMRVHLVATSGTEERARSVALVEVADPRLSSRRAGPRLTTGLASVWNGGTATTIAAADVSGQLTDSVRIHGRLVSDLAPEPEALRGLARVGYGGTPWYLSLDAPAWRADLGTVRVGYTSLTGESASGTGASASAARGPWLASAFGATKAPGIRDGSAEFLGLRLSRLFDSVRVGTTITHLRERSAFGRRLGAVGLDAEAPIPFGAVAASELAYRRHETGSGVGWATEVFRAADAGDHLRLRVANAPGGSSAFARGTRELSASASRRLSQQTTLGGSFWRANDASAALQRTALMGWSLAPSVTLSSAASVTLEIGGHDFETRSPVGGFGSGEHRIGLSLDGRWGAFIGSTGMQYGAIDRTVDLTGGAAYRTMAYRTGWRGSVATGGRWGAADLHAQVERSGAGSGYEPRRNEAQLRVQSPAFVVGSANLALRGELQHYGWFGDRSSIAVLRAAADLQLPWSVRLTLDAEHNPLFSAFAGGSPWSSALRVTRTTALPRLFVTHAAGGVVYQDLDGDGRRDPSEPGLASAVIRYGSSYLPTDERGRFAFETRQAGPPRLEIRSIPLGWIVSGTAVERGGDYTEIGVAPTSTARIRLELDTTFTDFTLRVPLSLIRVAVRNTNGRVWVAPVDAGGSAFFDALPAGRYDVVLDLSRLPEPLSLIGETSFTVNAEPNAIERTILLRTRPVRVRRIEPPPRDASPSVPES
jgi:hypothetical protein